MTHRPKLATVFAVLLLIASATAQQTKDAESSSKCEVSEEDQLVFAAVLDALRPRSLTRREILVLDRTLASDWISPGAHKGWGSNRGPSEETLANFDKAVTKACEFKRSAEQGGLRLTSAGEIESLFADPLRRWGEFYEKHPQTSGFVTFSNAGYSARRDEALVMARHSCGSLCGTTAFYLLQKSGGKWQVLYRSVMCVS